MLIVLFSNSKYLLLMNKLVSLFVDHICRYYTSLQSLTTLINEKSIQRSTTGTTWQQQQREWQQQEPQWKRVWFARALYIHHTPWW